MNYENPKTRIEKQAEPVPEQEERYEHYKNKFFKELLGFAKSYDYSKFTDRDFYKNFAQLRKEYKEDDDTYIVTPDTFSLEELNPLWQIIDAKLTQRITQLRLEARGTEKDFLGTSDWDYAPDGRLNPKIHNPAIIGGIHGDETTLPDQVKRVFENKKIQQELQIDWVNGYYNSTANPRALERMKRGLPSDMNRPDETLDEDTLAEKRAVLAEIGMLESPFVLDCHNYRPDIEGNLAYAYAIDYEAGNKNRGVEREISNQLLFKIKLAEELGLDHIIIVPVAAASGAMIADIKKYNKNADGMVVEVAIDDTENKSSKIALQFATLSRALNGGRPSAGIQTEFILHDSFLPRRDNFKIFQFELVDQPIEEEGAHYQIIDNKPFRISKLALSGNKLTEAPMSKGDIKVFEP